MIYIINKFLYAILYSEKVQYNTILIEIKVEDETE